MKLSIPRQDLVAALGIVKSAAIPRGSLPILANVALKVTGNRLELTATDLDITLITRVACEPDAAGACSVQAHLLHGLASSFAGLEPVQLEALKNDLKIVCGQSKYKLGTLNVSELPPVPVLKAAAEFKIAQHTLHRLLSEVAFAQGNDSTRHMINSSLLHFNGALTVVATNGRQLAMDESAMEDAGSKGKKADLIVPVRAVKELLRLLASGEPEAADKPAPEVNVSGAKNLAQFKFGDITLITKLAEGSYPNYNQVIPDDLVPGVPIGRVDLLGALKRVNLVADSCTLEFEEQSLTIRSRGRNKYAPGEAVETFLIPKTKKVNVGFNIGYLINALEAVEDDEVIMHPQGNNRPFVLKVASKAWICVTAALTTETDAKPDAPEPEAKAPKTEAAPATK